MNLYKTEVMWVGKQRDEVNIRFEDIKQVNNVVYLGGNISENARVDLTRFNKIAIQGTPQMAVD